VGNRRKTHFRISNQDTGEKYVWCLGGGSVRGEGEDKRGRSSVIKMMAGRKDREGQKEVLSSPIHESQGGRKKKGVLKERAISSRISNGGRGIEGKIKGSGGERDGDIHRVRKKG